MNWEDALKDEIQKPYFQTLASTIKESRKTQTIYPSTQDMFRAFELTAFDQIKVVILGQDPYHGEGQANGLAFSVNKGQPLPPSLQNIFLEISTDLEIPKAIHGDLSSWAKQGVLLLNSIMSVAAHKPASHANLGWEVFTSHVIKQISEHRENVFFLLWGKFAQSKKYLINDIKHKILETTHPSPFSAHKGFLGSKHFSQVNQVHNIDWTLA